MLLTTKLVASTATPRPAPTLFYYPGLTAQPFHNANLFGFARRVQDHTEMVKQEYTELRLKYKKNDYNESEKEHALLHGTMHWMKLLDTGNPNEEVRKLCPGTSTLLEGIPEFLAGTSFGTAYFSCLGPNSSLKPHTGPCNVKLRCHLPLFVHGDAFIRVAGRFAQWEEGKLLIFDETFVHEEANVDSVKKRVVLVFDIWHPDLEEEERKVIRTGYQEFVAHAKGEK